MEPEDVAAVVEVLTGDWLTTGPMVEAFERDFAEAVGASHAVSFSSGTAALHAAVAAAGLGPGDEAVTTPLTFCATANCLLYAGATPVFADVDEATLTLSPEAAAAAVTPRTKALIPMDYGGCPADLDAFAELARRHGLLVIEDACHAPGAAYKSRPVGSISDISVFSFHPVKHLTTGEGGMATTRDAALADRMRRFRNHGIDRDFRQRAQAGTHGYDMAELGYNYRLPDLGAALGRSQLNRLAANVAQRRKLAARYAQTCQDLKSLRLPADPPWGHSSWHLFAARLVPDSSPVTRDGLLARLKEQNIGGNVHYPPVHLMSYYRNRFGYRGGEFPVAERAAAQLLSLPLFHAMDEADVDDVARALAVALEAG